ncbi:MAG: hypothetical protein LH654_07035 [Thermoleophilia bacterium]|nr:hypothetical protein [Thermoleophilia bacterium]
MILVEGFDPDAKALARLLASEGNRVRLAGPTDEPSDAADLRARGIQVEPHADLDTDPGSAEIAYLDVWTPAVAPRVQRLKTQGTTISCLGDLLLERWPGPTLGITGTAGKTTTTALTASILQADGRPTAISQGARAGNLWPTADLLERLETATPDILLILELTSSHLAFMHRSPTIAAVISFWPDHLELHGDFAAYRAAKETIVRHQRPGGSDIVVVNADDASAGFAECTPAQLHEFSLTHPVANGAYTTADGDLCLANRNGVTRNLGAVPATAHPANTVAATAIAAAAGANECAIAQGIHRHVQLPWRAQPRGLVRGVPVIDDGMAATPAKTRATLATYPERSVVLVAGGRNDAGGGRVHATPEEHALLDRACDEIARTAQLVVLFGNAGHRLAEPLRTRRVDTRTADDLESALSIAAQHLRGAHALVFSPMFPLSLEERASVEGIVSGLSAAPAESLE